MTRLPARVWLRVARRRQRDERGAYAILFSMMLILVMALAAIAVDIASNVSAKQQLKDTMDAAAHTGAYALSEGGAAKARSEILRVARANDPTANPTIDTWCVVASTGAAETVVATQIPSTCNPGKGAPYSASNYPGLVCDEFLCFIPCNTSLAKAKCNTVRVADNKVVPYAFAPAIGYDEGKTGAVISVACNGPCGREVPNPLDVVIVADRTASMRTNDRQQMKDAIKESLTLMNPEMHQVALGTIHKSRLTGFTPKSKTYGPQTDDYAVAPTTSDSTSKYNYNGHWDGQGKTQPAGTTSICRSEAASQLPASAATPPILQYDRNFTWSGRTYNIPFVDRTVTDRPTDSDVREGTWIPVGFTNNYLLPKAEPTDPSFLNNSSDLVDSISCMSQSVRQEYGTNLASALKESVRYAFANNPAPTREGKIRKMIVFETDGQPSEPRSFGTTGLDSGDLGNTNGVTGCNNLKTVANAAKVRHGEDLLIVTIGFGDAATARCGGSGDLVRNVLASVASNAQGGGASTAGNCSTATGQQEENTDGDYFFCSTDGGDLGDIFATALTSAGGMVRFLQMPR
ncbi:TadE/TadG family type IV pilus assembly protein [Nocardioides gilvus]|uniref:TadE/TadG family type IV pilus assembly protein n=1 Tax=Nocardioides gilvus TaxID=1735589 RepID=UPI000D74A058|nr:TadE/TadG family type IV pilus assembly protein [Nocardioides gilvus]